MQFLPRFLRKPSKLLAHTLKYIRFYGVSWYCPVCERSSRKFGEFGAPPRKDAQCMFCGSLERHRLVWLFFKRKTNLFDGTPKHMLHFSPTVFEEVLRRELGNNYLTADLYDPKVIVKMDITNIQYPKDTFDVILCSHVLEHVSDDKQAIRELYRVLKPGGWAVLLVPVISEKTFEDPSVTSPSERFKIYGHRDHVRRYGPDFAERARESGFHVEVVKASDFLQIEEIKRMGIPDVAGAIYYCSKYLENR